MNQGHLNDRRLYELFDSGAEDAHVAGCAACQARLSDLATFTGRLLAEDEAVFERAFPDARIADSRQQVLAAIEARSHGADALVLDRLPPPSQSSDAHRRQVEAARHGQTAVGNLPAARLPDDYRLPGSPVGS